MHITALSRVCDPRTPAVPPLITWLLILQPCCSLLKRKALFYCCLFF